MRKNYSVFISDYSKQLSDKIIYTDEYKKKHLEAIKNYWKGKPRKTNINYKNITIENQKGHTKIIKQNQLPQYKKYGWKLVVPTGFEPV